LIKDLTPLLPSQTTMTANEGGNALVITDTQTNIKRMAEIVRALDTAISSTSAIRVFPLKYADAKALATVIKELFPSQDTSARGGNPMQQLFRGMRGGGGGQADGASSGGARVATPKVVTTSDERSNSLVVSAPEDHMVIIEDLVKQVDTNVDDVTELRVFHLKYADPEETADMLTSLFPDPTTTQNSRGQVRFGGGRFGGPGGQQNNTPSTRLINQARVIAVPDLRTGSIVVSASREMMAQIIPVVDALDSDPRRKQKVFVFDVENTDPQTVQSILQNLFPSQTTGNSAYNRNTSQQAGNQLNNRATAASSSQNLRSSGSTQNRSSSSTIGR
jgi:general secretion pathway protein D